MTYSYDVIEELFNLPFSVLMYRAMTVHGQHFDRTQIQLSSLKSIKTGRCSEDCAYCSQSVHYSTGIQEHPLMDADTVLKHAQTAKDQGAERFCMSGGWRQIAKESEFQQILDIIPQVKALGLETCLTVGMLTAQQAQRLKAVGLDYYNHNIDTSPEYYKKIITTRTYEDRLNTLKNVREAGIKTCSGGILGLGESREDRIKFIQQLANLPEQPASVPINQWVRIEGTPLAQQDPDPLDPFELVRTIAVARILMPHSFIRLSAGRLQMNDEHQALCFLAGANSIFLGERLLTTDNPKPSNDHQLLKKLGFLTSNDLHPSTSPAEIQ